VRSSGWATEVFLGSDVLAGATVSGMRVVKCDLRVHPLLSTRALTTEREATSVRQVLFMPGRLGLKHSLKQLLLGSWCLAVVVQTTSKIQQQAVCS
jgi:hypothetical protein